MDQVNVPFGWIYIRCFRRLLAIIVVGLLCLGTSLSVSANTYRAYGPPYNNLEDGVFYATVGSAVTAFYGPFLKEWGLSTATCPGYTTLYFGDGTTTGYFAHMMTYGSDCNGGGDPVLGTAQSYSYNPGKSNGSNCRCQGGQGGGKVVGGLMAGDPINSSTGNMYLEEDDYVDDAWLSFRRFYNSSAAIGATAIGSQWRYSFSRSLSISSSSSATLFRPDGSYETFSKTNGVWATDADVNDVLVETDNAQGTATSYSVFVAALRQHETYNPAGQLLSVIDETRQGISLAYSTSLTPGSIAPTSGLLTTVTDPKGREINIIYNSVGQIIGVMLPDGSQLAYTYDPATGNLLSVQYPDGHTRQYVYNESSLTNGANLPAALTGIVDESGNRFESTTYNGSGQATSTSMAGNVDSTQISYSSNGTSTVQYPLGASVTMGYSTSSTGWIQVSSLNQSCGPACNQPWKTITYDTNGNPQSHTDFNGNVTATTYDGVGLLTQQIDAQGTSGQRTTQFNWNTLLRVPLTDTVLDANGNTTSTTQWIYNATGQTLARCDIDPTNSAASGYSCSNTGAVPAGVRRTTYTYCTAVGTGCPLVGLMLTATGSRTDLTQVTSYSYYTSSSGTSCGTPGAACYQPGDLYQVTDALGHVTTIASYDADGRVTRITDANGINTDMTYTPRGWLASRSVGGATSSFTYTPYGAVQTVTDPDGVTTTCGYDAAHRLVKITDAQGNYIQYTLDAAGDKTAEQVDDPSGTLHKSLTRTFNILGQLTSVVDGLNHTVFNASATGSYDANGNLIQSSDGLSISRQMGYDALNRLMQTIDNYNGTN